MGSGEVIALQTSLKRFPKIPFAYKRASGPFLIAKPAARFINRDEFLFGRGSFRGERRLTGFRGARKIIRIRTKSARNVNSRRWLTMVPGTPFGHSTV
jgi:hypothetical protein